MNHRLYITPPHQQAEKNALWDGSTFLLSSILGLGQIWTVMGWSHHGHKTKTAKR